MESKNSERKKAAAGPAGMEIHRFAGKGEQQIEYFANGTKGNRSPVIISMGNWEPAFRGLPLLRAIPERPCFALSYRGRGRSFTPARGWDWRDHADDLALLVETEGIAGAVFVAFSKGVSYTLGFLEGRPAVAKGLVLIDYPAIHAEAEAGYARFWHGMSYNGIRLGDHVRLAALEGIERESTAKDFYGTIGVLKCPIAVFVGRDAKSDRPSNLSDEDLSRYRSANANVRIVRFPGSGHMILDEEFAKAREEVRRFLDPIE